MSETLTEDVLPEVAYYYPEPYWQMPEGDDLKSLLLFFDRVAILLPRYMTGREVGADPILAGPLKERGLLQVLEPEEFVDQEMTQALTATLSDLIDRGAFADLGETSFYAELSRSRMGWDADVKLASGVIEELQRRGLAKPSEDGVSVPLHPTVRTTTLVLISQLARSAGRRRGLDLHPVTTSRRALDGLLGTLSLPHMPSQGHIVALDLETVALNLQNQPLDEILDFRKQHGKEYRAYARQVRKLIADLSPLPPAERDRLLLDRRDELADQAHQLRRTALKAWRQPLASLSLGAAGAVWAAAHGDYLAAALAFGTGVVGASLTKPEAGAYSYLFRAQRELSRHPPGLPGMPFFFSDRER